jgi:phage tail sheath protein FI
MATTPGWMARDGEPGLASPRLQMAWPWPRTADSDDAQGGVEAPEGMLAGVLARSALERGSFRSAAHQPLRRWQASEPVPPWSQLLAHAEWTPLGELGLPERVCLLGPAARGAVLWSDASASADPAFRQAAVRRLVNVLLQAARRAGDDFAFDGHGEPTWRRVRERLSDLLRQLQAAGALASEGRPFEVRCGRDTMRQADLDAGRLIAQVEIQPAQPIRRIVVVLNLREAGVAPALAEAA